MNLNRNIPSNLHTKYSSNSNSKVNPETMYDSINIYLFKMINTDSEKGSKPSLLR